MEDNSKTTQPLLTPPVYQQPTYPAATAYAPQQAYPQQQQQQQQGYPPQAYAPQGYPPQAYPPQGYVYQQQAPGQGVAVMVGQPYGAALLATTCFFHPQFAAMHKCFRCCKSLCLECSHEVASSRWRTNIYCRECGASVRKFRLIFFIVSLIVFFVAFGIIMSMTMTM